MVVRSGASDALPTSHFFLTVARGRSNRTLVLRASPVFAGLAALPLLLLWLVGSTLYLTLHDDLVASLMLRQRDLQYDYEDRIATLRSQIDRAASREMVTQRSIAAKLDELSAREAELQSRSGIVSRLDQQAARALAPANPADPIATRDGTAMTTTGATSRFGAAPTAPAVGISGSLGAPAKSGGSAAERLSALSTHFDTITAAQDAHVIALDKKVRSAMARYQDALAMTGLSLDRLSRGAGADSGGPFVPLTRDDDATPFARSAVGLQLSLSQVARLGSVIARVPLNKPLRGNPDVTSPFGPRIDPFLGRPAMHTGMDLAEDSGTDVFATAPGRVTFAGQASGYGLMVEVDHGAGLSTRYAHLSEVVAAVGQTVKCSDVIGHVGATGRATGPHLHYETRIDGEAVDPTRFLTAGRRLFAQRDFL